MFQLSVQDIHPGEKAGDKEEAIRQVAAALVQAGNVAEGLSLIHISFFHAMLMRMRGAGGQLG